MLQYAYKLRLTDVMYEATKINEVKTRNSFVPTYCKPNWFRT